MNNVLAYIEGSGWMQLILSIILMYALYYLLKKIILPKYYMLTGILCLCSVFAGIFFFPIGVMNSIVYLAMFAASIGLIFEYNKTKS